jgi:hypothetical protein
LALYVSLSGFVADGPVVESVADAAHRFDLRTVFAELAAQLLDMSVYRAVGHHGVHASVHYFESLKSATRFPDQ